MKEILKNTLKILQIILVLIMPLLLVQYFFPQLTFLNFAAKLNSITLAIFSQYVGMQIGNGIDITLFFIIVPCVAGIILAGVLINIIDEIDKQIQKQQTEAMNKRIRQMASVKEKQEEETLQKKQLVYMTISVVFSKFTISNLSDREIEEKKEEIKENLIKDLPACRGKIIEDEAFDDPDTFAVLFISLDDAITFILKFRDLISYYGNITQSFGYTISYKAILDLQSVDAQKLYVLMFMEKALKAIEINEICATNDFLNKYKKYGKNRDINFESKGNYSINKSRVELNRVII